MVVLAAALPWSWRISLYALFLMLPYTLCYCIAARSVGNASLARCWRVTFLLLAVFSLIYVVSVFYSTNTAEGWRNATAKLTLALVSIVVLVIPKGLFTKKEVGVVMQFFTLSLVVRFIVRLLITLYDLLYAGRPHDELMGSYFDPLHHTYLSMYLLFALSYIALQLLRGQWEWRHWPFVVALLLVVYLVVLQSRAALLIFLAFAVAAWFYLFFGQKRVKLALFLLLAAVVGSALMFAVIPGSQKRLFNTITAVISGDYHDDRYYTTKATLAVISSNMPFGVGAGDREEQLVQQYQLIGAEKALAHTYNSHNQYLDTLMATGIPGLLVLVALFAVPLFAAVKERRYLLLALVTIVAFNALFESLFERQMGLIFFAVFCAMLAHAEPSPMFSFSKSNGGKPPLPQPESDS
ncbi:MAG: O-antigen ligase family protein [Bacteroidales bacterium]|nr:O-antigen ligase family protein [Bacteroidales bacterium]